MALFDEVGQGTALASVTTICWGLNSGIVLTIRFVMRCTIPRSIWRCSSMTILTEADGTPERSSGMSRTTSADRMPLMELTIGSSSAAR